MGLEWGYEWAKGMGYNGGGETAILLGDGAKGGGGCGKRGGEEEKKKKGVGVQGSAASRLLKPPGKSKQADKSLWLLPRGLAKPSGLAKALWLAELELTKERFICESIVLVYKVSPRGGGKSLGLAQIWAY